MRRPAAGDQVAGTRLRLQPHLSLAQLAERLACECDMLDALEIGGLSCAAALGPTPTSPRPGLADCEAREAARPQFSLEDVEAILDLPGRKAEQLLDVMMEVHAAAATGDGRFEMPRWLRVPGPPGRRLARPSPARPARSQSRTGQGSARALADRLERYLAFAIAVASSSRTCPARACCAR